MLDVDGEPRLELVVAKRFVGPVSAGGRVGEMDADRSALRLDHSDMLYAVVQPPLDSLSHFASGVGRRERFDCMVGRDGDELVAGGLGGAGVGDEGDVRAAHCTGVALEDEVGTRGIGLPQRLFRNEAADAMRQFPPVIWPCQPSAPCIMRSCPLTGVGIERLLGSRDGWGSGHAFMVPPAYRPTQ